jgi:ABC-type uncharacterized transport system permease subunit
VIDHLLFPELRAIAPQQRRAALRAANRVAFEVPELLAMAAGLVLIAALSARPLVALALGAAILAALFLRRTRRGLRLVLQGQA